MISFLEFVNKVESANPPILKEYKKKARLTNLQGVGLCFLILFSPLIPLIIFDFYKEYGRLMEDDVLVSSFFLIALGIGWAFFIYSIKHFTLKEKRKIYNPTSPTKLWDALVVISAICVFFFGCTGILPDFISISLALLSILCPIGYFLSPWRERQVKARIPLFQLLSILGWEQKLHDEQYPFFFPKHGIDKGYRIRVPNYFHFKLNGTSIYIGCIQFWYKHSKGQMLVLETITFNIPKYIQETDTLLKNIEQFIASFTGQDLFFHQPITKRFLEEKNGRLEISFSTVGDVEEFISPTDKYEEKDLNFKNIFSSFLSDFKEIKFHPNLYQDTYFYYTREDLDTIYKDVQTLVKALDGRY